jgi:hypothetical protein
MMPLGGGRSACSQHLLDVAEQRHRVDQILVERLDLRPYPTGRRSDRVGGESGGDAAAGVIETWRPSDVPVTSAESK